MIARVLSFAASLYLARTLGAEIYGIIGFTSAVLLYFMSVAEAGLDLVGMRELAQDKSQLDDIVHSVFTFRLLLAIAVAAILVLAAYLWLPDLDATVLSIYAITLIPLGLSLRWVHLAFERGGYPATARVIGEGIGFLLIVLVVHAPGHVLWVPVAQVISTSVTAILLARWVRQYRVPIQLRLKWQVLRPLLGRSYRLVIAGTVGLLAFNFDLIVVRLVHGADIAGYYAAAYMPIGLAVNLGMTYRMSLLPTLARLATTPGEQRSLYHTSLAQVFAVVLPAAVGGFLLAGPTIRFVFGQEYAPAGPILAMLIWTIPIAQMRESPQAALVAQAHEHRLLQLNVIGTVVAIVLGLVLIPPYGMIGAAVSTIATEITRTGLAFLFAHQAGFDAAPPARLWRPAAAAFAMAVVVFALRNSPFLVVAFAGAVAYVTALALFGGIQFRRGALPALTV
jgi:O-antigen/teichoic acid export membrane protein